MKLYRQTSILLWTLLISCSLHQTLASNNKGDTADQPGPLPLSDLFRQSDKYKCLANSKDGSCGRDEAYDEHDDTNKVYFGPRFQKVHLALPRRNAIKVINKTKY